MATRPIFVPSDAQFQLVREISTEFLWHAGLAPSQKRRNVAALHEAGRKRGIWPILEISTKSEVDLGLRLSAFNLRVVMDDGSAIPLESAFQGSKVFEMGGPFTDLFGKSGFEIKKDERLQNSGRLKGFVFQGVDWKLEPKTAFYDWLYIHAVHFNSDICSELVEYKGFTDIEFNPGKSINCQARSCALYVSLYRRGVLGDVLGHRNRFLDILDRDSFYQPHSAEKRQGTLFEVGDASAQRATPSRRSHRR